MNRAFRWLRHTSVIAATLIPLGAIAEPSSAFQQRYIQVDTQGYSLADFQDYYHVERRNTYYHGEPPENEYQQFVEKVRDGWIDKILMQRYAIEQEQAFSVKQLENFEQQVNAYSQRMEKMEGWGEVKDVYLPVLRQRLERESIAKQLEETTKAQVSVTESEAKAFYNQHPEKFTQPPRVRASLILIHVAPSAGTEVWQQAKTELERIRFEITNGADFAEMATLHSTDPTADQGGDMGYLHQGQISQTAEQELAKLKLGELSPVISLLNGQALFKLDERLSSVFHSFAEVAPRATGLKLQQKQEETWTEFLQSLRDNAKIDILIKVEE